MEEMIHLINEMSPYLLLGFFLAGVMHAFVPRALYSRYLSARGFRSVLYAALLGIPLPLCSCGVIPTSMSLRREGASKGATVSFLIATPQTGVDSIVATFSLMGWAFAIIRPVVALITALFGGVLVDLFDKENTPLHSSYRQVAGDWSVGSWCDYHTGTRQLFCSLCRKLLDEHPLCLALLHTDVSVCYGQHTHRCCSNAQRNYSRGCFCFADGRACVQYGEYSGRQQGARPQDSRALLGEHHSGSYLVWCGD